jgi:hypothetical protein
MPELIQLNKEIKENNKFKEMSYEATNKYIDQMDIKKLSNVLSSMGMAEDVNSGIENARNKLKQMIPKYSDTSSNEEYAKQLTDSFFVPFMQAAQSEAGGGLLSFGELFGNLKSGTLQESIRKSSIGQEIVTTEQEQKTYELGQKREEQQYQTGFERQYGFAPIPGTGEKETSFKQEQGFKTEAEEQQFQTQQKRSQELSQQTSNIINNATSSMDVWDDDKFPQASIEARNKAFEVWRTRENDELKEKLKDVDEQIKRMGTGKNKPVNANVVETAITSTTNSLISAQQKLAQLQDKDKNINSSVRKTLVQEQKWRIKQIEDRLNKLQKVSVIFSEKGDLTEGGLAKSYNIAEQQVQSEDFNNKKSLIEAYNSGEYKKLLKGRNAEQKDFINDYESMFGEKPNFDNEGKATLPQKSSTNLNSGIKFNLGTQNIDKSKALKVTDKTDKNTIKDGQLIEYNGKYYIKNGNKLRLVG